MTDHEDVIFCEQCEQPFPATDIMVEVNIGLDSSFFCSFGCLRTFIDNPDVVDPRVMTHDGLIVVTNEFEQRLIEALDEAANIIEDEQRRDETVRQPRGDGEADRLDWYRDDSENTDEEEQPEDE